MEESFAFRPLRRRRQELAPGECGDILARGTSGVLALAGDGGYPYAVPLSYVFIAAGPAGAPATAGPAGLGRIVFHSASAGHKIDAIARDPRASFCVIDRDQVVPDELTTYFRSVIAFGRVREVTDGTERRRAAEALGRRYAPGAPEGRIAREIGGAGGALAVLELEIEHLSGKEAIELARARGKA